MKSFLLFLSLAASAIAAPPVTNGLKLRFDGADIDTKGNTSLLDGQTVTAWKDLSGSGVHADKLKGTPTYIQPGPGFGGLPVVAFQPADFNGADHLSKAASPVTAYPLTVFAVVRSNTTKNAVIFSLVDSTSNEKTFGIRFVSEGKGGPGRLGLFRRNTKWVESTSAASFNDNRLHVLTARFFKADLARLYVDGAEVASSTTSVTLPEFNRFDIGNNGRDKSTTDPYDGQIAEILVYNQDITNADRTKTEEYLSKKWITGPTGKAEVTESEPKLERTISLATGAQDRAGVPDYTSHKEEGNLIRFDLANGAKLHLTLNTDRMARVQYAPDGIFRADDLPDYSMVQKFDWAPVPHTIRDHGGYIGIHTAAMTIRAQKSPFRLQMFDAENEKLIVKDADQEGMYAQQNKRGVIRTEGGSNNARFGFGSGDHGHSRPLDKSAGYDQYTVTHGRTCVPFFMSTAGYGVFLNTVEKATTFDNTGSFQTDRFLDYWFMAGDFKKVLGLYSELTGRMNLFPKWGYGFMLSKYGNDNATQAEFSEWINRLRKEDYPTDSYVFDFGWRGGKFGSHQWDNTRFPNLAKMFEESKRLGFHVGLHNNKGTPEAGDGKFSDPAVAEKWWQAHWPNVIKPGRGDWFWPDEFDVSGDNLMANRAAKVVHERWLKETTAQRPMFFTRGGFAGHHFSATWSGDIPNNIGEMSEQITGSLALGLSGYPWCSNDLGGFFQKPTDELYIRWVTQFGAFSGIMRAHGHDGREPWLYGKQVQENLRRSLKTRYRLFPYIYTTAWQGTSQGIPMMRAMALEHSENPESWTKDKQYYFGDWLLVAPALATTATDVSVWLPEGKWYDFFNPAITHMGGRTITVKAALDQIPVFVKEGAIIPTGPEISHADEKPLDPLTIELYPGSKTTTYSLYEDDGITRDYMLKDAYSLTEFTSEWPWENGLIFTKEAVKIGNPAAYKPKLPRSVVLHANHWTEKPKVVIVGSLPAPEASSETSLATLNSGWFWSAGKKKLFIRFTDDGSKIRISATVPSPDRGK